MVEKKLKFLRIYLILTLVFGVIGLSDSILSLLKISSLTYSIILGTLSFVFFFFNIFALVHIMQEKLEKITWVLPTYHILTTILFTILGIILSLAGLLNQIAIFLLIIIGLLSSIFEIGFSVYLLKRFKFF